MPTLVIHFGYSLQPTNPIRLGVAVNYSGHAVDNEKNKKKGCDMAKLAFDLAISKVDQLDDASYKESTLIMQLLRDNLTLWTSSECARVSCLTCRVCR